MGKSSGSQTVTSTPDPQMQGYRNQLWNAANSAAGSPPPGANGATTDALAGYQNFLRGGNLGLSALTGDPGAAASFMSPYQSQVLDAMKSNYGWLANQAQNQAAAAATRAGAFGGSRSAIMQGEALGALNRDQAQQMAQLAQSGYSDSMNRAAQAANLGFGAAGQMQGIGDYLRQVQMQQDPNMWRFGILQQALGSMPGGQTQTTTGSPARNGASGFLGGAATGAGIGSAIPGIGTAIGAGVGGLLGLFG